MRPPRPERRIRVADTQAPLVKEEWQADAYAYATAIGEVNYALSLKANTLARCRLRPEMRQPNTADDWAETGDPRVLRVHKSLQPPLGGPPELLRKALRHLDIAGEALDIDTLVPTPTGFTTMGSLEPGDVIYGGDGQTCRVLDVTDIRHGRPCYEVVLTGGARIVADADHLWATSDLLARTREIARRRKGDFRPVETAVLTTTQIAETLRYGANKRANHAVPLVAIDGAPTDGLIVDPYVLGYWLGDGTHTDGCITVHPDDQPHLRAQIEKAGYGWSPRPGYHKAGYSIGILGLQGQLRALKVFGNKHIPPAYLRAPEEDRWALLQGLIDSDGHVDKTGRVEFSCRRPQLTRDVIELTSSLGLRPGTGGDGNRLHFVSAGRPVARLPRKAERIRARNEQDRWRYIEEVNPVDSRPVRCIAVDSPDHTFLVTERMVPTHNCWLLGTPLTDAAGNPTNTLVWEFLSVLEVDVKDGGGKDKPARITRNPWGASKGKAPTNQEAYLARLHRSAADYSARAESPMQGVLAILRQIVLLTQVIDAIAQSRLTANMLYVPWEVSMGPFDESENPGGAGGDDTLDEFEQELREHLTAPITDHSSESSLIPLLMRGPALIDGHSTKDLIGIIDLARQLDDKFQGLRKEALDRLAAGLDLPPELMQGKGSLSGLGGGNVAESIDAEFIEKHVIPPGNLIAEFLTVSYLRPMLIKFEGMTPDEADWFRYALDTSAIEADPDRSAAATSGRQMGILSDDAWITANGFTATDAIDPDVAFRRKMLELSAGAPTILAPYLLPLAFPDKPEIVEAMKQAAEAFQTPVPKPSATPGGPADAVPRPPGVAPAAPPGRPGGPGGPQGVPPPRRARTVGDVLLGLDSEERERFAALMPANGDHA